MDMMAIVEQLRADADVNELVADEFPDEVDRYLTARLERAAADYIEAMTRMRDA